MMRSIAAASAAVVLLCQPALCIKARPCDWQRHFSSQDFRNPAISELIKVYKKENPPNPATIEKLASFGRDVVPFMDRLACEKKRHYFFLDPKGGWFGTFTENPYYGPAANVLKSLKDPTAVPILKAMMLDNFGGMAQQALINLQAEFSTQEIEAIIDQDAEKYTAGYRIKAYAQMAQKLPPDAQAEVYTHLFARFDPAVGLDGSANYNWITMDDSPTISHWIAVVDLLASTRSISAKSLLEKQYSNLTHAKAHGMGSRAERLEPLFAEYGEVLARWK